MNMARFEVLVVAAVLGIAAAVWADPVGTAFTYQGQLKENGLPVTDYGDFRFTLYDCETPPTQVGPTLTFDGIDGNPGPIAMENGLFTVRLDFGTDIFTGEKRCLEIEVRRPSGAGEYTTLTPPQELTPSPQALYAETAGTTVGGVTGSGTNYRVARFTGTSTIGNSELYQNSHGNIGVCGAPYWGGIAPGWGPNLQVNTGDEHASVWIGGDMATEGNEIGRLSWVGGAGLMMDSSEYAGIAAEIVSTNPFPRGALLFYTSDTPVYPPPEVEEAMRINPNGNVGIGTDAPQAKLHVGGIAGTDGIMFPDGTLQTTAAGGGGGGWVDDGTRVRLETSTDSVGIGTSTPGAPLSVIGKVRGAYDSSEAEYVEIAHGGSNGFINWSGDGNLNFRYNSSTLATLTQSGNLGIGSASPASKLDVAGIAEMDGFKMPTGAANGRVLTSDASGVGTWQVSSGIGGSGSANYLPRFTGSTPSTTLGDSVVYQNGSSIGVGTTCPGEYAKLHVHSDTGAVIKITNAATGTEYGDGTLLSFLSTGSADAILWNRENANLLFGTNNTERMRLTSNGSLAIGHTSPWCKLDVRDSGQRVLHVENTAPSGATDAAVYALSGPLSGAGTAGDFTGGFRGLLGSGGAIGVEGIANGSGGTKIGVYGHAAGAGTNYAGYFDGNVYVTGTINKSACSFKIDHPLAPAEKYLYHSVIESPDMKNVYDGVAVLDADGTAWVQLPDWFEALNKDYRYQLTCVGGYAPVYVAEEIAGNRFQIAGGKPGLKVCWQVTGIRQDAYANAHRLPVEVDKPAEERGTYLHPGAFGLPQEQSVHPHPKQ